MNIREDDLTGEEIAQLLQEHLEEVHRNTPRESIHTLGLEALRSADITLWTAWDGDVLLGCGALKELDSKTGEIKSMRTVKAHRGKGVASMILKRIVEEANLREYECINLETGSSSEFVPARALYLQHGFELRGPFAEYVDDSNSVFMTKKL